MTVKSEPVNGRLVSCLFASEYEKVRISAGSSDAASLTEPARRSPPGHEH
jgi:hypothetical protein